MSLHPILGCHLHEYHAYIFLVNIMHKLLLSLFTSYELVAILLYTKIYFKELNNFCFICLSGSSSGVLALLGLSTTSLWCVFISIYWCILSTCFNLVFLLL